MGIEEEVDSEEEVEMVVHVLVDDRGMEEVDSELDREMERQVDLEIEMGELLHREMEGLDLVLKEVRDQKEEIELVISLEEKEIVDHVLEVIEVEVDFEVEVEIEGLDSEIETRVEGRETDDRDFQGVVTEEEREEQGDIMIKQLLISEF